jgi:hypothetical protein
MIDDQGQCEVYIAIASVSPSRLFLLNHLMDFDNIWYVSPLGHTKAQRHIPVNFRLSGKDQNQGQNY